MADFITSYRITKSNEGGYVNDPRDNGGETYKGISRKYHPEWIGWRTVDAWKKSKGGSLPRGFIIPDKALDQEVLDFYKKNFWDVIYGDQIRSQQMANLVFDFGVNGNYTTAISFLERIEKGLGFPVTIDGRVHPIVLKAMNGTDEAQIYKALKERIKAYYQSLATNNPSEYAWALPGWLNRLKKFPDEISDEIKKKADS